MGVARCDRHTIDHIHHVCQTSPVELVVMKHMFRWLGHVTRMPESRYPKMVYGCVPVGGLRGRGRPKGVFRHTYASLLEKAGCDADAWMSDMHVRAQDRNQWRKVIHNLSFVSKPQMSRTLPWSLRSGNPGI
jgi:hypothetical protein